MKKIILITISVIFYFYSFGAYLYDVPITITQPDGTKIECFATGDEYYNWAHDADGYTIIQDKKTGYYCYAVLEGEDLVASKYVVGRVSPKSVNLKPNINISGEKIMERVNEFLQDTPQKETFQKSTPQLRAATTGMVNNIVVYIRFADQTEFPANQSTYTLMFNNTSSGYDSMRNYFKEVSYNQLDVVSHFYPINNGTIILSYQDSYNRNYYCPYDSITNPSGYKPNKGTLLQKREREHALVRNAIDFVKSQIPSSLNIDYNNDGYVDNICFIVRGDPTKWNTLLWPHQWFLDIFYTQSIFINGKKVDNYNFQIEEMMFNSVLCHEMSHTFGAPDLYHYNNDGMKPVDRWDLMSSSWELPQHWGAYMKYKYGGWIPSIPTITTSGTYTLQPLTSATNNCYKIPIKGSSQYIVVEYRKKTGTFENSLPGSGLIIYRINPRFMGNGYGVGSGGKGSDEVYVFRPNGTTSVDGDVNNAYFSDTSGRTSFCSNTNPYCFTASDGSCGYLCIKNIQENSNNTLSFSVLFCADDNVVYSNTSNLPTFTNASHIQTSGTVIVKSTDNITFEIGDEVILNPGFEIQPGGTFNIDVKGCDNN